MTLYNFSNRAVVRIAGPDAQKLLNDTLTATIDETAAGIGRWFALLSPQGKVLIEGLVTYAESAFWFDIDAGLVADFLKRMKLYRLRAKAEIEDVSAARAVLWSPDGSAPRSGEAIAYRDARAPGLGTRFIVDRAMVEGHEAADTYDIARIAGGVPEFGPDFTAGEVFAHDIGLDILNGIDFRKGCYIGQEVVSRMKHRGTARRRPVIIGGVAGMGQGAPVVVEGREAGSLGRVAGDSAMAILRLDRITDPGAASVNGRRVALTLPGWATYAFGESAGAD